MNRAESILAAITTKVTGLTQTGSNVVRGRVYPVPALPALTVNMGAEQAVGEPNMAYQDEFLDIDITAYAQDNTGVDTALNQIVAEVYAAMLADRTQGLAYVHDTSWRGRSAPDRTGDLEKKTAQQTMVFRIHYRHSYTSMES